jgi:hypothetical protein
VHDLHLVSLRGSEQRTPPPYARASGIKVRVAVEQDGPAEVFLLYRRGDGDLVIGASDVLEALRNRLGHSAAAYEIAAVPVVRSA